MFHVLATGAANRRLLCEQTQITPSDCGTQHHLKRFFLNLRLCARKKFKSFHTVGGTGARSRAGSSSSSNENNKTTKWQKGTALPTKVICYCAQ